MIGVKGVKGLLTSLALLAMLAGCLDTAAQPEPGVMTAVSGATGTPDASVADPTATATGATTESEVTDNPAPVEPTVAPAHMPVGPAPAPGAGWMGYVNSEYGYQLWVPQDATIKTFGVQGFPTDELPEGMSVDVYLAQLGEKYPEGLCVEIQYDLGYIYISAAANPEFRYATCGRTGAGGGEMRPKSDAIMMAGEVYTAHGFEHITTTDFSSGLQGHNESMVLSLADGTRIEYGARPDRSATYEEYVAGTRPALLQIVSSYRALAAP